MMASERDPIPCPVCREVIIGPLSAAVHLSDMHGLSMYGALARLARELEEARERLKQYQRLVVFADSTARARGDACGLCDALGRDDQPYQSHRAADLIAEAERALIARRGEGGGE